MCAVPNVLDDIVIGRIRGKGRRRYDHFFVVEEAFFLSLYYLHMDGGMR